MDYLTDGSTNPATLSPFLNLGTLAELPDESSFPKVEGRERIAFLKEQGFVGIQGDGDAVGHAHDLGLLTAGGSGRLQPGEYDELARQHKDAGHLCTTLHVGTGLEGDAEADRLFGAIGEASAKSGLPLYVETHRATLTQDVWRTVELLKRHPRTGINADLSHWYTGLEMPYGGVELNMDYAAPVIDRVRFMHGRIGTSGLMQADIGDGTPGSVEGVVKSNYVRDFELMWGRIFEGFKRNAPAGSILPFAPELLWPFIGYGLKVDGRETTDRWDQAIVMRSMAERVFDRS